MNRPEIYCRHCHERIKWQEWIDAKNQPRFSWLCRDGNWIDEDTDLVRMQPQDFDTLLLWKKTGMLFYPLTEAEYTAQFQNATNEAQFKYARQNGSEGMKTEKQIRAELKRLEKWYGALNARERAEFNQTYHARCEALEWVLENGAKQ